MTAAEDFPLQIVHEMLEIAADFHRVLGQMPSLLCVDSVSNCTTQGPFLYSREGHLALFCTVNNFKPLTVSVGDSIACSAGKASHIA